MPVSQAGGGFVSSPPLPDGARRCASAPPEATPHDLRSLSPPPAGTKRSVDMNSVLAGGRQTAYTPPPPPLPPRNPTPKDTSTHPPPPEERNRGWVPTGGQLPRRQDGSAGPPYGGPDMQES
ncbi:unnamed protein product [Arctogadus glacialis]